jgi:hypothetical protein
MRHYRRNSDARERDLEREAAQGDFEASLALVRSYLRTGKASEDQIAVMASLKAEPYRTIAEERDLDVENLGGTNLGRMDTVGWLGAMDTGVSTDLMLAAVHLALVPGEFGGPRGFERAEALIRATEHVRSTGSDAMARVLWRMTQQHVRRRRRQHYGPGGRTATGPSEWQTENEEAASAAILQDIFTPAARIVVVFYAHGVADEFGMGYGRIDQWYSSMGWTLQRVFYRFYNHPTRMRELELADSSGVPGRPRLSGPPPFTRFRLDLTKRLSERWGIPLATKRRRRRRR